MSGSIRCKRFLCLFLCVLQIAAIFAVSGTAEAASNRTKTFTQAQAQSLSLVKSADIKKQYNAVLLKQMNYVASVAKIKATVKNIKSFRWSPLISFKFPSQLNMSEEYDLNIKPLTLQVEINSLKHGLADLKYQVLGDANKAYLKVYVDQEKVSFAQERLTAAQQELTRNQARLVTGDATQSDIDKMTKSVDTLTKELSEDKRNFETAKSDLSDMTGLDITANYTFINPMKSADVPRDQLSSIINYTLQNDQTYYEAKMAVATAKLNLDGYLSLMQDRYGSKMNLIMPYINMAKQGMDIDYTAFKSKYDEMLKQIDSPWNGKIRILFFRFTKEWFKGELSGTRYIQDDMYSLYTACKEYATAVTAQTAAEKALKKQINTSYESLVTSRNAYNTLADTLTSSKEAMDKVVALNKLGKAEYSEVQDKQKDYQDVQLQTIDALSAYDELLYDFDRLTCGAVTKYLSGASVSTDAGEGGDSYAEVDKIDKPYYYINSEIDNMIFAFGVSIPDGFEPEITDYELWYQGTQIGARTSINKQIRHFVFDYGDTNTLTVRFYKDGTYVDECDIDTTDVRDVLNLKGTTLTAATQKKVGTYKVTTNNLNGLNTSTLTIKPDDGTKIKYFSITYGDGKNVYSSDPVAVDTGFTYLTLLVSSLDSVSLTLYDEGKTKLYTAKFDTSNQSVVALLG
jgi:hypothetical protein